MPNNLRILRNRAGWSQDDAAAALGTTRNQYVKLERGSRRLSDKWIERAAGAYGVDPGEVVRDRARRHPLVGSIEADGSVLWTCLPQDRVGALGALAIVGCALHPMLEGWRLVISTTLQPNDVLRPGHHYVVQHQSGANTVRKVIRANAQLWHLEGWGTTVQFDQALAGGFEVVGMEPS